MARRHTVGHRRPPSASEVEIEQSPQLYVDAGIGQETIDDLLAARLQGRPGRALNNDAYRLRLPGPDSAPFAHFGKPGHEAEARELLRLAGESDGDPDAT